mmetsp:Transcript_10332/g.29002  ORF Transcript_10332/g.29002 Transcript_10332/m.29002 type:complete len:207 (-) Transcript_10332:598-1218(-)
MAPLMMFWICIGITRMGNRRRLNSARAGNALSAVRLYPMREYVVKAAKDTSTGPEKNSTELMIPRSAALRIHASSSSRRALIRRMYGSSHAYSLMALMPEITSEVHLTRLSVRSTSSLRIAPTFFPMKVPRGIMRMVMPRPAKAGPTFRMFTSMAMMVMICNGPLQTMCRYCGRPQILAASLLCRFCTFPALSSPRADPEIRRALA